MPPLICMINQYVEYRSSQLLMFYVTTKCQYSMTTSYTTTHIHDIAYMNLKIYVLDFFCSSVHGLFNLCNSVSSKSDSSDHVGPIEVPKGRLEPNSICHENGKIYTYISTTPHSFLSVDNWPAGKLFSVYMLE